MAKILGVILVGVYLVWFFTVESASVSTQEIDLIDNPKEKMHLTQKEMHDSIKSTVEKEGWNTTEFKNNALIAEKITQDNPISVTITFSKSEFFISPENIDLQNAINNSLGIY